jgi:hypothetical protein
MDSQIATVHRPMMGMERLFLVQSGSIPKEPLQ